MFEEHNTTGVAPCLFRDDWFVDNEFMFEPMISEKHSKNFQQNTTSLDREKTLEKNREAAFRCRQKKKKWTQNLEEREGVVVKRNEELAETVADLKEEALYLRNLLLMHANCDCKLVQSYIHQVSKRITSTAGSAFIKVHPGPYSHSHPHSHTYLHSYSLH